MDLPAVLKGYFSDIPVRALRPWLAVAVLMTVLQALPADWRAMLRYDRDALATGQAWRLLTANFVHLGWRHLLLNLAGFLLIGWLFAEETSLLSWLGVLLVCCMASSLGLYWFAPEITWVVGMSGALHGLFVFGAVSWLLHGYRAGWGLLLGVCGKLYWEQSSGAVPLSVDIVGGAVVTEAHLWGAIGGLCAGLGLCWWRRLRPRL